MNFLQNSTFHFCCLSIQKIGNLKRRNKAAINNKFNLIKTNWDKICMFQEKKISTIYWYIEGMQNTYISSASVIIISLFHRIRKCDYHLNTKHYCNYYEKWWMILSGLCGAFLPFRAEDASCSLQKLKQRGYAK